MGLLKWPWFTRSTEARPIVQQMTPKSGVALPFLNIYVSCKDLPLSIFIQCLVSEDLSGLIISGEATDEQLADAWLTIHSEYCSKIGGVHIAGLISRTKTIYALDAKIQRITVLCQAARQMVSQSIADALKESGYPISVTGTDEEYLHQITRIEALLNPERMKLSILINEAPKPDKNKSISEDDFTMTLMEISKQEGYKVSTNITVMDYCLYVKRLNNYIKNLPKVKQHGRSTGKH